MNWKAANYETVMGWRAGKVHILADDGLRSRCGKTLQEMGGRSSSEAPDCKTCIKSDESERQRREALARYRAQAAEAQEEREEQNAEWWRRYNEYLRSPGWRAKSAAVLRRAGGTCEACGTAKATQAHHVTYARVFEEPLFDLRAVCVPCHERLTEHSRARRGV